jgi:hypothetical protein
MTKLLLRLADTFVKLGPGRGGRRPGAGRKPSTITGILKRLPPEAAELLIREFKAKAELIQVQIKLGLLIQADISAEIPAIANHHNGRVINNIAPAAEQGREISEKQVKLEQERSVSQGPEKNCSTADDSPVSTNKRRNRAAQGRLSEQVAAKSETLAYRNWKASLLKQANERLQADRRRT